MTPDDPIVRSVRPYAELNAAIDRALYKERRREAIAGIKLCVGAFALVGVMVIVAMLP